VILRWRSGNRFGVKDISENLELARRHRDGRDLGGGLGDLARQAPGRRERVRVGQELEESAAVLVDPRQLGDGVGRGEVGEARGEDVVATARERRAVLPLFQGELYARRRRSAHMRDPR
jgi:hypothetical protein